MPPAPAVPAARQSDPGTAPAIFGHPDDPRAWVRPANQIAARITAGTYPPGQWLPSQRQIAASLSVNQTTVSTALTELAAKGILTHIHGTGHYAGNGPPPPHKPPKPRNPPRARPAPPPSLIAEQYITVRELAQMLRVSMMTGYRICRNGDINGVIRIGKSYRIPETGARAYLAASRINPDQPHPAPEGNE